MKIAVTGASGHVGTNLCRMLISGGHSVKALIHKSSLGLENLDIEFTRGDLADINDLKSLCRGCDVLFHLAATISLRRNDRSCLVTNAWTCKNVLEAAREEGVKRIVHFSSIHAFSHFPMDGVLDEERKLALESRFTYDRSKALGQTIMAEWKGPHPEVIILNPTAIIGPNDFRPSLLGNAVVRFYRGGIPGLIPGGYNWVDVRDVCSAAINAMTEGTPGQCYLLGGSWQSLRTLAETIHDLGGKRVPRLSLPLGLAKAGALFFNLQASLTGAIPLYTSVSIEALKNSHKNISSARAERELGFRARPFGETMADTVDWFKTNGYI